MRDCEEHARRWVVYIFILRSVSLCVSRYLIDVFSLFEMKTKVAR